MNLFTKLPGFVRTAPGLEQRIWRRLPAILLWGTLLPLLLAGVNHALAPAMPPSGGDQSAVGPAYVADAYVLPLRPDGALDAHTAKS